MNSAPNVAAHSSGRGPSNSGTGDGAVSLCAAPSFPNREPIAANCDPITSHQSAEEITSSCLRATQKRAVLAALRDEPLYVTSFELAHRMSVDRHMVAKRLPDLAEDGLAERCPARNCSVTGRKAITWRAAR